MMTFNSTELRLLTEAVSKLVKAKADARRDAERKGFYDYASMLISDEECLYHLADRLEDELKRGEK